MPVPRGPVDPRADETCQDGSGHDRGHPRVGADHAGGAGQDAGGCVVTRADGTMAPVVEERSPPAGSRYAA
ncbi:hypothetical protein BCD48_31530 [Pseudofrankia sp. BMG5.36]|nr:hypothetical protein BCD48_31530 [Pseudofrankia sp. BMG5.36]